MTPSKFRYISIILGSRIGQGQEETMLKWGKIFLSVTLKHGPYQCST